jgi:hypothetical protein
MKQDKKHKLKAALRDNLSRRKSDNKAGLHRPPKTSNIQINKTT